MTADEARVVKSRLRREFERHSFAMPGYRIELIEQWADVKSGPGDAWSATMYPAVVRIHVDTADSRDPSRRAQIVHMTPVPPGFADGQYPADEFTRWLRATVHRTVCHEADEWLRRDGVMIFNPHGVEGRL